MAKILLMIPVNHGVGLTSVCLGVLRALDRLGARVGYTKPLAQPGPVDDSRGDGSSALVRAITALDPPTPITSSHVENLLSIGEEERLLEEVVGQIAAVAEHADVVVVEALVPTDKLVYSTHLNVRMAAALDAEVVLVGSAHDGDPEMVAEKFAILARECGPDRVAGCIVNRVAVPDRPSLAGSGRFFEVSHNRPVPADVGDPLRRSLADDGLRVVGLIPAEPALTAPRVSDIARDLDAEVIFEGQMASRRVMKAQIGAMTAPHFVRYLSPGTLVITPGDRPDLLMTTCLAELSGNRQAGILLTGGLRPAEEVVDLCRAALDWGLPVLLTPLATIEAAERVVNGSIHCPVDDRERIELITNHVAPHLDRAWIASLVDTKVPRESRISPPAFRHRLIEQARAAHMRIVLPEGHEPRTLAAAAICAERGIARCVLLGDPDRIRRAAARASVVLPEGVEIVDPTDVLEDYVAPLVELRKHKGVAPRIARDELGDTMVLGTMMLAQGDVDGLVAGAINTTANTVRPALRLIKTAPGSTLVSSVFFMLLPDQVLVYGDCAVNPTPDAAQLAEIALQSADSAEAFGIPARVAMLSYATGVSSAGEGVDKVARATRIAQEARPDLLIDGPLQYDAALIPEVARSKAPDSPVAGRATVFVFPDLDAGNTTYKAVQRAANVVSLGPMLQGLARPVNDLSRGCVVEDIVYTIALTAIQAKTSRGRSDAT